MSRSTRRDLIGLLAGIATAGALRGDDPILSMSGVDHFKVRVANAGASAMFYYGLFGGDIVAVRNSTFPNASQVDEFFLKIGSSPFPYLALSGIRGSESPGLDHVSVLAGDLAGARSTLARNGIALIDPDHGLWFRDTEGTLIELMARPTWGSQAASIRLPVPANLRSLRPAFETAALARIQLRVSDVDRSAAFYRQVFGSAPVLRLRRVAGSQTAGLDRLVIDVRNVDRRQARRILQQRGVQGYGRGDEVLFRDPDGNEVELAAGELRSHGR